MIRTLLLLTLIPLAATISPAATPDDWWNPAWTIRQSVTINTADTGAATTEPVKEATVLVRLHAGNFQFLAAAADGSDLRFIAADGQTILPHYVERFDSLINEGFVWVKLPDLAPAAATTLHLYYGAASPTVAAPAATDAFDSSTTFAMHFAERGGTFTDATRHGNQAEAQGIGSDGGIIGGSLRLLDKPFVIRASESLEWAASQPLTWSAWLRPAAHSAKAVVFSKSTDTASFRLLLDQGVPLIEISGPDGTVTSTPGEPVATGAWSQLAFVAAADSIELFVDGAPYASLAAKLPALNAPNSLGGPASETAGTTHFNGEIDALTISNIPRSGSWLKLAALNQGSSEKAQRVLFLGEAESAATGGHSEALQHVMLFGDIAGNMMFDGWIAVGICIIMIVVGWSVAIRKFGYLNKIEKGNKEFLKMWKSMSTDLTALDHADGESLRSIDKEDQALMKDSPLYQIYHIGSEEISHRLDKMSGQNKIEGLPGRSIQAIRASLDAGLVHENHRLTDGLVYLTISVAGGPYVGLLGTVVGVMITFAIIAKSGEVNVNSIAPGIASALLATVAGLVVAIPALFIYSYLNSRIKKVVSTMQVFIDEFVAKMAEFYRPQTADTEGAEGTQ